MSDATSVLQVGPDEAREIADAPQELHYAVTDDALQLRDASKRELDIRLVPWNTVIDHEMGPEMFVPGAFADVDPRAVVMKTFDADGKHRGTVVGRGQSIEERADAAYLTVKVSGTAAGDELMTLAADRVINGASMGFLPLPGGSTVQNRNGRRVLVHQRVGLDHVVATWRPAYPGAGIVAMRSKTEGDPVSDTAVAEPTPAVQPATQAQIDAAIEAAFSRFDARAQERATQLATTFTDRIDAIEERNRSEITFPAVQERAAGGPNDLTRGNWLSYVLRSFAGEKVSAREIQERSLADLITSDNIGVVPPTISQELIGIIDPARPFLASTRQLPTPETGNTLQVPTLVTRPTAGVQASEKTDITSTETRITNTDFSVTTIAGGGDISLQLLRRSSPSYLSLYLQLLAEAYSNEAEVQGVATLLDSGTTDGTGNIDPNDLEIGEAWTNAVTVSRLLRPDRIWMSTAAIQEFIDAKEDTTNRPLYSNLAADITVANGARGLISGLTPVYVPALDGSGADVVIGPSRGFGWAEDGSYELQVDVPAKAGKDVALVGMFWFAPLYPAAFTTYRLAS